MADSSGFMAEEEVYSASFEGPGTMLPSSSKGVTTIMRQQSGDQLLISACGRTCSVDMIYSRSIVELQAALQRTLQMEGQAFHICDINGQLLSTDMQVQDAIAQGLTPLCATLPDKSLHHLENRREELAQMQWKVVRDQMTQSTNQVSVLSRQINELQFQMQSLQRECSTAVDHLKLEMGRAVEIERVTSKAELQPIQEAVNGAVLLINGERSKRELSVQGFEKHIHGVCDMLDGERASRRQDLAMQTSVIQELKNGLDAERAERDNVQEALQDLKIKVAQFQDETSNSLQDCKEQLRRAQAESNILMTDTLSRFVEIEDRCAGIEATLNDTRGFNTQTFDKLSERHERLSQVVETLRLGGKHYEGSIANALDRVKEGENLVRQHGFDVHDQMQREKQGREDSLRRVQQSFTNDVKKQCGELEKRLTIRLERESSERERNFQSMIDEMSKVVQDRDRQKGPAPGSLLSRDFGGKSVGGSTKSFNMINDTGDAGLPGTPAPASLEAPTGSWQPYAHEKVPFGTVVQSSSRSGTPVAQSLSRSGTPLRTSPGQPGSMRQVLSTGQIQSPMNGIAFGSQPLGGQVVNIGGKVLGGPVVQLSGGPVPQPVGGPVPQPVGGPVPQPLVASQSFGAPQAVASGSFKVNLAAPSLQPPRISQTSPRTSQLQSGPVSNTVTLSAASPSSPYPKYGK